MSYMQYYHKEKPGASFIGAKFLRDRFRLTVGDGIQTLYSLPDFKKVITFRVLLICESSKSKGDPRCKPSYIIDMKIRLDHKTLHAVVILIL